MQMDRNLNEDGRGKYALVLLRSLLNYVGSGPFDGHAPNIQAALDTLRDAGALDLGNSTDTEFFVIRLKDRSAEAALNAYATDAAQYDQEWAREVFALADKAKHHPCKKTPD